MLGDSHRLVLTRVLPASREEIFAAWTDPDSVRQWMCPDGASVALAELGPRGCPRVGGAFRVDMLHEGQRLTHRGVYREIVPPALLVFTWVSPGTYQRETLVRIELRPHGDGTELTLIQTLLPDAAAVESHTRGWSQILARFAATISP